MSKNVLTRVPALVVATCLCSSGLAAPQVHTVRKGESVSSIAKQYYGNFEITDLLLRYNGKSGSVIQPGEELQIPICEIHRVSSGDTLSKLARRHLGDGEAYRTIAELNGMRPDRPLHVGQKIVIPVVLPHVLARGESLAVLAKRFYGDTDQADLIQSFNGIEDPRKLSVGQRVDVPLVSFVGNGNAAPAPAKKPVAEPDTPKPEPATSAATKQAEPPKVVKTAVVEPAPPPPPQYQGRIALARKAYSLGEYARARELLEDLQPDVLRDGSDVERSELLRLTAFVYVAFDLPVQACAAHRSLSRLSPKTRLDPDFVSPKIRQMLSECMQPDG